MPPSGEKDGADASLIQADLWRLLQAILDESEPALGAMGLTTKAFFLLENVEEHPFPAELARRMHLPPPTVTYLVKQLEGRGFLERRAEPGDLRKFRLVPTDGGLEAIRSGREAIGGVLGRRLARLGPEEVGPFGRAVRRLAGPVAR